MSDVNNLNKNQPDWRAWLAKLNGPEATELSYGYQHPNIIIGLAFVQLTKGHFDAQFFG